MKKRKKSDGRKGNRNAYKHGLISSPVYHSWRGMKKRCNCPRNQNFKYYGARGIGYCKKWESFSGFLDDMGASYSGGLTLDRIDNEKDYSKENCRWVPASEQSKNRRNLIMVSFRGKKERLCVLSEKQGVHHRTVYRRIFESHWSVEKALTTPTIK